MYSAMARLSHPSPIVSTQGAESLSSVNWSRSVQQRFAKLLAQKLQMKYSEFGLEEAYWTCPGRKKSCAVLEMERGLQIWMDGIKVNVINYQQGS